MPRTSALIASQVFMRMGVIVSPALVLSTTAISVRIRPLAKFVLVDFIKREDPASSALMDASSALMEVVVLYVTQDPSLMALRNASCAGYCFLDVIYAMLRNALSAN